VTGLHRTIILAVLCAGVAGCAQSSAVPEPGSVLFQDDFARRFPGWRPEGTDRYVAGQDEGVFRIRVPEPNAEAWATAGIAVSDVRIEVDGRKVAGADDNHFGVICRYADARDFVFILISSDGYAGIGMTEAGQTRMLSSPAMMPAPAIQLGEGSNHLRAECVGDSVELYVNGQHVASATTPGRTQGDIGLIVGANGAGGVEVTFDNFSALQP
jgi:hypothetical protein